MNYASKERIFLGTGANLGDPMRQLSDANRNIEARAGLIIRASRVYRTQAWGIPDQADFLNQVLEIRSALPPETLLQTLLDIERDMGRQRQGKWRERLIDLDLLFYGKRIIDSPSLTLPHPYLAERNFVLHPLREIAPDWVHPVSGKTVATLCEESEDPMGVEVVDW